MLGFIWSHDFVIVRQCNSIMNQSEHLVVFPGEGTSRFWRLAAFLGLAAFAVSFFDITIANFNRHGKIPGDFRRILHLSELFAHGAGVLVACAAVYFLAVHKRQYIFRLAVCAFWPGLIVQLVKHLVQRIRPGKLVPDFPETVAETFQGGVWVTGELNRVYDLQAFPSGHTATAVGLAVGLSWLFPRGRAFFFALAALAALQRISSGSHWASDVLVGAAIGLIGAGAITQNWGIGGLLHRFEQRCMRRLLARGIIRPAEHAETANRNEEPVKPGSSKAA